MNVVVVSEFDGTPEQSATRQDGFPDFEDSFFRHERGRSAEADMKVPELSIMSVSEAFEPIRGAAAGGKGTRISFTPPVGP